MAHTKHKGFTLIEVLVVLSILAITAILGYNFLGNAAQEAKTSRDATAIISQAKTISVALEEYQRRFGALPALNSVAAVNDFKQAVLTAGILRSWPSTDPSWRNVGSPCSSSGSPGADGWMPLTSSVAGKTHYVASLSCVSAEICAEINRRLTSIPGVDYDAAEPAASIANLGLHGGAACVWNPPLLGLTHRFVMLAAIQ